MKDPFEFRDEENYILDISKVEAAFKSTELEEIETERSGKWWTTKIRLPIFEKKYYINIQLKEDIHYLSYSDEKVRDTEYEELKAAIFLRRGS